MQKTAHIIGAGISGLSAAVRLANANYKVQVHEATQQAGGRCRSYFDAATNLTIDNGNHLLLARGFAAPREPVRIHKWAKIGILLRYAII